jgi:hypothetical protein
MAATEMPMTPGRVIALILGVPVSLGIIGLFAMSLVAPLAQANVRFDRTVTLPGPTAGVTVDNPDLTLTPVTSDDRVIHVSGTFSGSFAKPAFALHTTATGIAVTSRCLVPTGNCSGSVDVTVPAGVSVLANDSNGDLTASGLSGQVTLSAESGDLTVGRLSGTVSLADASGQLTASGLSGGTVRLSDSSGDITASGVSASAVTLTDSSGDITVTGLDAADVTGKDQSGNITLTFTKAPRRVDVSDSSGDITLVLPPGPAYYQVSAQTVSGGLSVGVRRRASSPYVITAAASSGDVTIRY